MSNAAKERFHQDLDFLISKEWRETNVTRGELVDVLLYYAEEINEADKITGGKRF